MHIFQKLFQNFEIKMYFQPYKKDNIVDGIQIYFNHIPVTN